MTHEQLRAFVAVVERGGFRAAAAHLFKTQPSISAAVNALEHQFEITLFNRESYRPELTSEGKTFYRQAKSLLGQMGELETLGHQLAKGTPPTLTISLSAMCTHPPGLEAIRTFGQLNPEVQLTIQTEHLSGVLEQLELERAELAIGPHLGVSERHELYEISKIQMVTVAAQDFLDGFKGEIIPQNILRNKPQILLSDTGSLSPFDPINVIAGGQRWFVNDYYMKKTLVLSGMGWTRIPLHIVEAEIAAGELVRLEIERFASQSNIPIYLIHLRDQPLSELARAFRDAMLDLAKN
ncbi:MAG: LysR family transcriptional regulator [Neptuniibacter sp.]